ncbi:MAG: glycosyltransferase [Verrucomicrobia bacterium]|jgi:glycosyltransferase involved in cell wall biosynthesis|nr:glycosyltransferase [Verrucomicrobiota bacterium]
MRILEAVSTLHSNGAVQYASRVIPALLERGHEVTLAALPGSWIVKQMRHRLPILETRFDRWPMDELRRFASFFREEEFDLLHTHLTRANNFGALLHLLFGIPNAAHAHENKAHPHYWFHDLVIGVSRDTLRRHRRYGAGLGGRGAVLPNFVDTRKFRPAEPGARDCLREELNLPPETPVLVQVGDISPRKGQRVTLEALPRIWAHRPETHMVFIGRGERPGEAEDARIRWLGYREDVADLLPFASAALQPSLVEPFGFAAVEAMACGVPLVASRKDGLREIIEGGHAVSIRPNSASELAAAALNLLEHPTVRARIVRSALARVRERYTLDAHVEALLSHFRGLLRRKSLAGPGGPLS